MKLTHREVSREYQWGAEETEVSTFFGVLAVVILCAAAVLHFFS